MTQNSCNNDDPVAWMKYISNNTFLVEDLPL